MGGLVVSDILTTEYTEGEEGTEGFDERLGDMELLSGGLLRG